MERMRFVTEQINNQLHIFIFLKQVTVRPSLLTMDFPSSFRRTVTAQSSYT